MMPPVHSGMKMKKWKKLIADRILLWKMERILEKEWNVKLSKEQRAVILSPARKKLVDGAVGARNRENADGVLVVFDPGTKGPVRERGSVQARAI